MDEEARAQFCLECEHEWLCDPGCCIKLPLAFEDHPDHAWALMICKHSKLSAEKEARAHALLLEDMDRAYQKELKARAARKKREEKVRERAAFAEAMWQINGGDGNTPGAKRRPKETLKNTYYAENRDRCIAMSQKYYAEHKDEVTAMKRRWYREHADEIAAQRKAKREAVAAKAKELMEA